jgi:hypothetical protein
MPDSTRNSKESASTTQKLEPVIPRRRPPSSHPVFKQSGPLHDAPKAARDASAPVRHESILLFLESIDVRREQNLLFFEPVLPLHESIRPFFEPVLLQIVSTRLFFESVLLQIEPARAH